MGKEKTKGKSERKRRKMMGTKRKNKRWSSESGGVS